MPKLSRLPLALFVVSLFSVVHAAPLHELSDAERQEIDKIAQKVLKTTSVPSASIAVVIDGKLAYAQAYGDAALKPRRAALPNMRYGIGSISKQFTATALLMLQEEGKLSLDDKVSTYVANMGGAGDVTIRQLLSHTAGIRDYWPQDFMFADMRQAIKPEGILDRWARQPLDFPAGERWQYSNTGYVLAGVIFEKVANEPLMSYLQRKVFSPLQMSTAMDCDQHPLAATDSVGYTSFAMGPLQQAERAGEGWMFAAGELAMTAGDLAKWDISLMEQKLMSKASYDALEREVLLNNGAGSRYALGMGVEMKSDHRILSHGGEINGYLAENTVIPDSRMAIVVLTNADASNAAEDITDEVRKTLFNAEGADGNKQKVAEDIFRDLQHGKIDRKKFSRNGNEYFSDSVVKEAGRELAKYGKLKSFTFERGSTRGGMETRVYEAKLERKTLQIVARVWPNGEYEQYGLAVK
ncbi:MAG TPA: serine hydrolase domain-containing protein [Burkholderiaceae bacterium]